MISTVTGAGASGEKSLTRGPGCQRCWGSGRAGSAEGAAPTGGAGRSGMESARDAAERGEGASGWSGMLGRAHGEKGAGRWKGGRRRRAGPLGRGERERESWARG